MKRVSLFILATLLLSIAVYAQNPPATSAPPAGATKQAAAPATPAPPPPASSLGGSKVAIVDFSRCVTDTADGKKIGGQIDVEGKKRQTEYDAKKAKAEDLTKQLQTDTKLTEAQKADMSRQITTLSTDMERINQDWQRDLGEMQQSMFAPVAAKASEAIKLYANENGIAIVFDNSGQASNIIFALDVADITTEIIRRVDTMKTTAAPAARPAAPSAPPANRPTGAGGAGGTTTPPPPGQRPPGATTPPPPVPNKPPVP